MIAMLSTPTIMMASTQERLSKFGKDMSNKRKPQLNKLTDALKNIVDEEKKRASTIFEEHKSFFSKKESSASTPTTTTTKSIDFYEK